jgi:hypothetical protein
MTSKVKCNDTSSDAVFDAAERVGSFQRFSTVKTKNFSEERTATRPANTRLT